MKNLNNNIERAWKTEALEIFKKMLKDREKLEDFENCVRLRDNIKYLESYMKAPSETKFPHPFEWVENDTSVFLKFVNPIDQKIDDYLGEFDKQPELTRKRKRNKE